MVGGHVEDGKSHTHALARELHEEFGITADVAGEPFEVISAGEVELSVCIVTGWSGLVRNASPEEHTELRWFTVSELDGLPFPDPAYLELVTRALAG